MFERQARQPFPIRNIVVLAVAVLLFFLYLAGKFEKQPAGSVLENKEEKAVKDAGLTPAEWFHLLREYPDFKTNVPAYTQAMTQLRNASQQRGSFEGFTARWTQEGPGNIGARINTIKVHPTNPNIIYIGYSTGGVWKTVDGGQNWFPIFDQQAFLSIGDIELDPQNPNTVYVGTGDPNVSGYPFIGDGLWKSTNGGQSWQHLGLTNQRIISKIVVHPTNANILYVATMGLPFERNNDRGLYKTINGGQSWQQVLFVSDQTGAIDLKISPADPNVLYVAMWDRIRNNQESVVVGNNARIWKTSNAGANWTMLAGGLPETEKSRIGLEIDATNANHLVAIYADTDLTFDTIFESFDAGANWAPMDLIGLDAGFQSNFAWYFGKIFINPYRAHDLFTCGVSLWRSKDAGVNWYQATPDWWTYEVHADKHDMAFISANTYLVATDGGLYKTTDDGQSWLKIENIPTNQAYRVAYNPFFTDFYYCGLQDNGTTAGDKASINEWPRLFGGDGFQTVFHPVNPDIFYFETQDGAIYGTADGTGFIDAATNGIDEADRRSWDMQYQISAHDPEIMYTGTYRIYQSYGHLPTWFPISEDLTDGIVFGARFHVITTLHESPVNPENVYAGTSDGNVWHGNPFTQTWTNISNNLPDRYVSCVKGSPNEADRVFVSHTGYKSNDFTARIHRSDDKGNNWTSISGDLPNFAVNDLLILPGHQDSVLFAATDGGVYGTLNGGQHWERLGAGMPIVPVYDIEWNIDKKTLFAGTFGRSIYSFPLDSLKIGGDVSTSAPGNARNARLHVTPNLVHAQTTITVENLKSRQMAEILVTDLSGRVVWKTQCQGFGKHALPLETQQLPSGMYVVFAQSDGRVWAHEKFVVVAK